MKKYFLLSAAVSILWLFIMPAALNAQTYEDVPIYTLRGTRPSSYVGGRLISAEISQKESDDAEKLVRINYPNAVIKAPPTCKYNCHGYTFRKDLYVENPNPEFSYPPISYTSIQSASGIFNGCIVQQFASLNRDLPVVLGSLQTPYHSGIATGISSTRGWIMGVSKWGKGPLVYHPFALSNYPVQYGTLMVLMKLFASSFNWNPCY